MKQLLTHGIELSAHNRQDNPFQGAEYVSAVERLQTAGSQPFRSKPDRRSAADTDHHRKDLNSYDKPHRAMLFGFPNVPMFSYIYIYWGLIEKEEGCVLQSSH